MHSKKQKGEFIGIASQELRTPGYEHQGMRRNTAGKFERMSLTKNVGLVQKLIKIRGLLATTNCRRQAASQTESSNLNIITAASSSLGDCNRWLSNQTDIDV